MRRIGGFDVRYANGYEYEDNDLLERISRICEPTPVNSDTAVATHLWHPKSYIHDEPSHVAKEKRRANFALYDELKKKNDRGDFYRDPQVEARVEVVKNF
jgi:hypothetical protein